MIRRALLASILGILAAGPALASDLPEAQVTWRLQFGSQHAVATGYGLALAYRAERLAAPAHLVELDVSNHATRALIAGVPLFQRDYRMAQDESAARPEFRVALSKPWYAKSWVWWAVGGAAATAALAGAAGGGESEQHTLQIQDRSSYPVQVNGDMEGGYEACTAGTTCTSVPGQGGG